ncbi:MAG TPA: hypothetical protein VH331_14370 [Allosphingosinicella sp.]|nr:hypothetical protein [Allosphingosinicella sp.]
MGQHQHISAESSGGELVLTCARCGGNIFDEPLPIPRNVQTGAGWTQQMLEMADHIGAYATLLLCDRFGGMRIYITADWLKAKAYPSSGTVRDLIGDEAAQKLSFVYRREYLAIPTARAAVNRARRAPIIAAARSGSLTASEAARLLRTTRPYISHLVHNTDEGMDFEPSP